VACAFVSEPAQVELTSVSPCPEANDDIDTVHVFPDHQYPSGGFPSGGSLKVLLGFRNNGESPMNVSHIAGSVNSPQQFSMYVVNLTSAEYKTIVGRGLHSSTSQLNLSRVSREITLHTLNTPLTRASQALRAPPIP